MIALALLALMQVGTTAPPAQRPVAPPTLDAARMGVSVRPETVTVGDAFTVHIRVAAPANATIQFPASADSGRSWEQVDPRALSADSAASWDRTATYRLVAWDTGAIALHFADIVVKQDVAQRRLPVGELRVYVRSVLPADTTLRQPKGARDIVDAPIPWWWWWPYAVAALIGLLLLMLLIWWWRRRRRRGAGVADPFSDAEREFARIDALGLVEAGESGRFVALNVEVLRDYLATRVRGAPRAYTSSELLRSLPRCGVVPIDRLTPVLHEVDLIKFARQPVTAARAGELAHETRAAVRDVETAATAQEAAERAEATRDGPPSPAPEEPERAA
ncbi:MAG: hypothetical protein ABJD07_09130 [Gemmatimonadaceae bacterium]